jgi:hypothetical protein
MVSSISKYKICLYLWQESCQLSFLQGTWVVAFPVTIPFAVEALDSRLGLGCLGRTSNTLADEG